MLRKNAPADHKYMTEVDDSDHNALKDLATIVGKKAQNFNPRGSLSQLHCPLLTTDPS
jgi:hypothetical protein